MLALKFQADCQAVLWVIKSDYLSSVQQASTLLKCL